MSKLRNQIVKNIAKQIGYPPNLVSYIEESEIKGGTVNFGSKEIQIDQGAFDTEFLRMWGISGPAEIIAHEMAELMYGSVDGHDFADEIGSYLPGLTKSQRWNLRNIKRC